MLHPFYSLALHRAAVVAVHKGQITETDLETINSIIIHPVRKNEQGQSADVVELSRQKTVEMATADSNLPPEMKTAMTAINFNWSQIWTWFVDHLPQILSCIASILAIFMIL